MTSKCLSWVILWAARLLFQVAHLTFLLRCLVSIWSAAKTNLNPDIYPIPNVLFSQFYPSIYDNSILLDARPKMQHYPWPFFLLHPTHNSAVNIVNISKPSRIQSPLTSSILLQATLQMRSVLLHTCPPYSHPRPLFSTHQPEWP